MLNNINTLRRFHLNHSERKILSFLVKKNKKVLMQDLVDGLKMKRLTVLYNLRRLENSGFARKDTRGKSHLWTATGSARSKNLVQVITPEEAYHELSSSPSRKIYGIQGTLSIKNLVRKMKEGTLLFERIHRSQKLRQVIIDAMIAEDSLEYFKDIPNFMRSSHRGRPSIIHILPKRSLNFNQDILCDSFNLYFIDTINDYAVVVRDKYLASSFLAIYELLRGTGRQVSSASLY